MEIYKYPDKSTWPALVLRPDTEAGIEPKRIKKILKKVKKKGDQALLKFTRKFDGVEIKEIMVDEQSIANSGDQLSDELRSAIQLAKTNIEKFHLLQATTVQKTETMPGIQCWRRSSPIDRVGFYIPGGSAPLFSTVLMLAIPAKIAGCDSVIICTPPRKDGTIDPAILYAASICGVNKVAKVGGAQAIAAMAYGTESIPRVKKIFGPGNSFVTMAKQMVQLSSVAIDMPAGPSEVLVIADDTADPDFVAADLLSQAEHGPDSQVILLTTDPSLPDRVITAIENQAGLLPRVAIAEKALENSKIILLEDMEMAFQLSDLYAPEHLILSISGAKEWAEHVNTAGSVFIGNYSPESVGDYASGTNHCLPTNGFAAMYSGVSVDSFQKKITFQQLDPDGLRGISEAVMTMAKAEGLDAHKQAVKIRMDKINNSHEL